MALAKRNKHTTLAGELDIQHEELRGFTRSIAELQWLMLILVLLFFAVSGTKIERQMEFISAMVGYAGFVLAFRYINFNLIEQQWKLALETWVMILFISWVLASTGTVQGPMVNLYLLVIIASALTLGKWATLMETGLIMSCYVFISHSQLGLQALSLVAFSDLMSTFTPFVLVAYLTTMLASDIQAAKRKMIVLSQTDELTGLLNMRAFHSLLNREQRKFARYGHGFSTMMIDADGLKAVNDRFGHETGNRLVMTVADTIQHSLRETDVLARYGGDEFVVLLPDTTAEQAAISAERIRVAVENTSFNQDGERISATVSIGIASCPDDANDAKDLLEHADSALYRSKQSGRNQATRYTRVQRQGSPTETA